MNEGFEIILIGVIIVVQVWFYLVTRKKISLLRTVFGEPPTHKINRVHLSKVTLENTAPLQILNNLAKYHVDNPEEGEGEDFVSLGLLAQQNTNPVNKTIHDAINTYLIRNSGASPDFNLIKDIAERNSDAVEEEIGSTISIPLYLGLLGTLLGIIFGLWNISGISFGGTEAGGSAILDMAIPTLLSGVKIAMFASFMGLLLTIVNSGIFYKTAKSANVRNKNDFFTFVQVELLPILNQNLNSTLYSLQSNLLTFNKEFGQNIQRLDGLMNKNYDALVAQEHVMDMLSNMDIAEFATANVKTLKQLQTAIKTFGDFNEYAGSINFAIQRTDNVISRIDGLMKRTDGVETIIQQLLSTFNTNHELMEFLSSHFTSLDTSKQMISDSVIGVNEQLSNALDELRKFTAEKMASIQRLETEHVNLMTEIYPERWKSLDELKKMTLIVNTITDNGNANSVKMAKLTEGLQEVKSAITIMDESITAQLSKPTITETVKGWFKKENPVDEEA